MRALFALLLAVIAGNAVAAATPSCYSGLWYEPSTSGSGFAVNINETVEAVTWFTFDNGEPVWFTAQGSPNDSQLLLIATAGLSVDTRATSRTNVGAFSFTPTGLNTATITFSFLWPSPYCSGFSPPDPLCFGTKNVVALLLPHACVAS